MAQGTLIIAGGATTHHFDRMLKLLIESAGGTQNKFALIVSASGDDPDDTYRDYQREFARMGVDPKNLILIPLYAPEVRDEHGFNALNGDHPCLPGLLEGVQGVWFTGGDQYYTAQCFLHTDGTPTRALELLHDIYQSGGAIGGSSAGAAIMSRVMIGDGSNRSVIGRQVEFSYDRYDEITSSDDPLNPLILTHGLGFFEHGIVDQHFNCRPRLLRLMEACMRNPEGERMGYGVSEDTAMVVRGDQVTVLGAASVFVVDCRRAERTAPGAYDHVSFHALQEGDSLDLATGDICLAKDCSREPTVSVTPDYVAGGFVYSPAFDEFISNALLRCGEESMAWDSLHREYCARGVELLTVDGVTYAVVYTYLRNGATRGYFSAHTSFVDVELATRICPIQL